MFLNIFLSFSLSSAGTCWASIVIFPPGDKKTFQCTSLMKLFRRTNFFCQKWPWTGSQKIDFAAESNCVKGIIRPHENVAVQHLQTGVSSSLGHKATAGICTEAKSCCYFISRCRVARFRTKAKHFMLNVEQQLERCLLSSCTEILHIYTWNLLISFFKKKAFQERNLRKEEN